MSTQAPPAERTDRGRRAGGHCGHRIATGQPSSRAQDPGGPESCTHTHTRARTPANPFARRSRKALPQLFIHSLQGEALLARVSPSRDHRGLKGRQMLHRAPPSAHSRLVLSTRTHNPADSRSFTTARVAPAQGPHPPGSPQPRSPAEPRRPDLPRSARRAQTHRVRDHRRREAPATPKSRRLRGRGRALGGGRGRRAGRKEEGAGSKSSDGSGLGRAPVSSPARGRGSPPSPGASATAPGTLRHLRSEPPWDSGRELRAGVGEEWRMPM